MSPTLIIVFTRLHADKGTDWDEYRKYWRMPDERSMDGPAKFYALTDCGGSLLLVHGHNRLPRDKRNVHNFQRIMADAMEFVLKGDADFRKMSPLAKKPWIEMNKRINPAGKTRRGGVGDMGANCRVVIMIHGTKPTANAAKTGAEHFSEADFKWLGRIKLSICEYSFRDRGPAPFLEELGRVLHDGVRELTEVKAIVKAVESEALSPAEIQRMCVHELRELLLAFSLDAAVAGASPDANELKGRAQLCLLQTYREIERRVQSPAMQLAKGLPGVDTDLVRRIYTIADDQESKDCHRGTFDPPEWACEKFWKQLIGAAVAGATPDIPELTKLAMDVRKIGEGLSLLLDCIATGDAK